MGGKRGNAQAFLQHSAVFGSFQEPEIINILIADIQTVEQPRKHFDEGAIAHLAQSIKNHGLLEPILVHQQVGENHYELIAGERRLRAVKSLNEKTIRAVVHINLLPLQRRMITLTENLLREDLNPLEEVEGILEMIAIEIGQEVQRIPTLLNGIVNEGKNSYSNVTVAFSGKDKTRVRDLFNELQINITSFVTNRLPLINLPEDVKEGLRLGMFSYSKARLFARVKNEEVRQRLMMDATDNEWSVRAIKDRLEQILKKHPASVPPLQTRLSNTVAKAKKQKLWEDPQKSEKLTQLLDEIEALLN